MKGQVVLCIQAERAWNMYRDNETISKIKPEMLTDAHYVQGDGSPGTLRLFKFGPGTRYPPPYFSLCTIIKLTIYASTISQYSLTYAYFISLFLTQLHQCVAELKK